MVSSSDMRIVISQSPAAERIQNVQQQHPDLSQREFALQVQDQQEQKRKEVQDSERTEGEKIEKDQKKEEKRKKDEKRQLQGEDKRDEEGQENPENLVLGKLIDIRV